MRRLIALSGFRRPTIATDRSAWQSSNWPMRRWTKCVSTCGWPRAGSGSTTANINTWPAWSLKSGGSWAAGGSWWGRAAAAIFFIGNANQRLVRPAGNARRGNLSGRGEKIARPVPGRRQRRANIEKPHALGRAASRHPGVGRCRIVIRQKRAYIKYACAGSQSGALLGAHAVWKPRLRVF